MTKTLSREVWRGRSFFVSKDAARTSSATVYLAVQTHLTPSYRFVLCTRCYSCVFLRGTKFEGNRSSPLYAICLNWIHEIQFVDFDSKLFYGRHYQIEPDGEHPTSSERNSLITSLCARQTRTLCIHTLQLIVPMPPTINSLRGIGFHLSMHLNPNRALSHPDFVCRCYTDTQICNFLPLF